MLHKLLRLCILSILCFHKFDVKSWISKLTCFKLSLHEADQGGEASATI